MQEKHNPDNNNSAELPSVAIVITGKNTQGFRITSDSIESQSYENISIIKNEDDYLAEFFNDMKKGADIYGFLNSGDVLEDGAISKVVDKLKDKNIGGLYGDISIEHNGTVQQFYFPSFNQRTFSALKGVFPFFVGGEPAIQLFSSDTNVEDDIIQGIKYLCAYAMLLKISKSFSVAHIPELLVNVAYKEIDITSDISLLDND